MTNEPMPILVAKLFGRDGFIAELVAVPTPVPDVVLWRDRFFLCQDDSSDKPEYFETSVWRVP